MKLGYFGGGGGATTITVPGAAGDDKKLMETVFNGFNGNNSLSISFLTPGKYDLYIYCWGGSILSPQTVNFDVWNGHTHSSGSVFFGSVWPGHQIEGQTYALIHADILPDFPGFSMVFAGTVGEFNVINGMQIVPVPGPASGLPLVGLIPFCARRSRGSSVRKAHTDSR